MGWCVFLILVISGTVRSQNCRGQEPRQRACENVCDDNGVCKIRAALLLPKNTTYNACLSVVEPVFELALQDNAVQEVFPSWLQFEWMSYDVQDCDAAYAVISAIDAYNDCAHVFFGPSCDFALGEYR
ncbi:jg14827 [Pararge aegeria aegeria]|uniref:Jg14827 protein n=1 Tax=Pararge aegeria aegeria TaxID=348720 RepID=A0A8S4RLW9_9NEOP|nr:jg14827 [Pararge aegeria aegeria]